MSGTNHNSDTRCFLAVLEEGKATTRDSVSSHIWTERNNTTPFTIHMLLKEQHA